MDKEKMMEENGYLILTACFCLLFLAGGTLSELKKKPIHLFLTKKIRFSTKARWGTVINVLAAAGFILFLKKFIYYFSFTGIMQSKFSIWWVDKNVLFFLYYLLFLFLYGFVLIAVGIGAIAGNIKSSTGKFLPFLFFVLSMTSVRILENLGLDFGLEEVLYLLVFSPLLFMKMLCSGKYLGLLTSLVVAYYIVDTYKELKPKITRSNVKFLVPFGVVFWVFLVFSFTYLPLNWEEKLLHQLQTAKNRSDFLEVLEPTKSMKKLKDESDALKRIALEIAKTGEIQRAKLVAEHIPDVDVKNIALKEIQEKIRKK
jgi:hypothetical protein